jgi:hypothetical protein
MGVPLSVSCGAAVNGGTVKANKRLTAEALASYFERGGGGCTAGGLALYGDAAGEPMLLGSKRPRRSAGGGGVNGGVNGGGDGSGGISPSDSFATVSTADAAAVHTAVHTALHTAGLTADRDAVHTGLFTARPAEDLEEFLQALPCDIDGQVPLGIPCELDAFHPLGIPNGVDAFPPLGIDERVARYEAERTYCLCGRISFGEMVSAGPTDIHPSTPRSFLLPPTCLPQSHPPPHLPTACVAESRLGRW